MAFRLSRCFDLCRDQVVDWAVFGDCDGFHVVDNGGWGGSWFAELRVDNSGSLYIFQSMGSEAEAVSILGSMPDGRQRTVMDVDCVCSADEIDGDLSASWQRGKRERFARA